MQVQVSGTLQVTSPGSIPAAIYAYDVQGLDQVVVSVRSGQPALDGDSTFVFTSQNEQTVNVLWRVPSNIPIGTRITLSAKAKNLVGFVATDSVVLAVQ